MADIQVQVQCKATGHEPPPIRFRSDNRDLFVDEIVDKWCGDNSIYFKVRADDKNLYILIHSLDADVWLLNSLASRQNMATDLDNT